MKTTAKRRLNGPKPRALARAVAAIRRDSVASGIAAISMAQIDREVAVVRSRRSRASKKNSSSILSGL